MVLIIIVDVSIRLPFNWFDAFTPNPMESCLTQLLKIKRLINSVNKSNLKNFIYDDLNTYTTCANSSLTISS